jgi:hypothetical protein
MNIDDFLNDENINDEIINVQPILTDVNNIPINSHNNHISEIMNNPEIQVDIKNILYKISDKLDYYINDEKTLNKINNKLIKIISSSITEYKNRCIKCGQDMGINNPRQLCGKTKCNLEQNYFN